MFLSPMSTALQVWSSPSSLKLNKIGKIDFICGINLLNVVWAEILGIYSPWESICKLSAGLAKGLKPEVKAVNFCKQSQLWT